MEIKDKYVDKNGKTYNIRNINCKDLSELRNIGKYVAETQREVSAFWSESDNLENGVYIYQSNYDPKRALRIYKNFALYKYVYHSDARDVSKLQEYQKNIKLTEFPTGILTIEDYVIGQEIPFYENFETLYEHLNNIKDINEIYYYYYKIIDILEELYNNGIIYKDLHAKNFMIKGDLIKLIDFENDAYMYGDNKKYLLENLRSLINFINEYLKINFKVNSENIDGLREEILVKSKKIV